MGKQCKEKQSPAIGALTAAVLKAARDAEEKQRRADSAGDFEKQAQKSMLRHEKRYNMVKQHKPKRDQLQRLPAERNFLFLRLGRQRGKCPCHTVCPLSLQPLYGAAGQEVFKKR